MADTMSDIVVDNMPLPATAAGSSPAATAAALVRSIGLVGLVRPATTSTTLPGADHHPARHRAAIDRGRPDHPDPPSRAGRPAEGGHEGGPRDGASALRRTPTPGGRRDRRCRRHEFRQHRRWPRRTRSHVAGHPPVASVAARWWAASRVDGRHVRCHLVGDRIARRRVPGRVMVRRCRIADVRRGGRGRSRRRIEPARARALSRPGVEHRRGRPPRRGGCGRHRATRSGCRVPDRTPRRPGPPARQRTHRIRPVAGRRRLTHLDAR